MNIKLNIIGDVSEVKSGILLLSTRLGLTLADDGQKVIVKSGSDKLVVKLEDGVCYIHYSKKAEFFRGLALLCSSLKNGKSPDIEEKRQFATCGSMYDVSRGIVLKKEVVYDLLDRMALMGLDMFMLYTEDNYEMPKYPWFGYMRGAYSLQELKDIDSYADILGIEVISCIQTLGHLSSFLKWPDSEKYRDTRDVLLVGSEDTYELIDEMFKTMRSAFKTRRIHIGMDEAIGIGTGRYLENNPPASAYDIITEHLQRVSEIAKKYDFSPMIWSDMFFRLTGYCGEYDIRAEIPENLSNDLPENDVELTVNGNTQTISGFSYSKDTKTVSVNLPSISAGDKVQLKVKGTAKINDRTTKLSDETTAYDDATKTAEAVEIGKELAATFTVYEPGFELKDFTVASNKASVNVYNGTGSDVTGVIIVAGYSEVNGELSSISFVPGFTAYASKLNNAYSVDVKPSAYYKVMFWEADTNKPLTLSIKYPTAQ